MRPVACASRMSCDRRADDDRDWCATSARCIPRSWIDVGPLPPGLRRDRRGAVEEVLEHGVEPARGEPLVAVPLAALADVGVVVGPVGRRDAAVIVQRDEDALAEEPLGARLVVLRRAARRTARPGRSAARARTPGSPRPPPGSRTTGSRPSASSAPSLAPVSRESPSRRSRTTRVNSSTLCVGSPA